jgi:phosphoglycerol transferase MdoB-like AlkP superfamily enzyme
MPLTDKIQSEGITFTNMLAHGKSSETAHIPLLQGVEPRESPLANRAQAYDLYTGYTEPLPIFLKKRGYETSFLSTVTLSFLNERDFIKKMGFDRIIGEEEFTQEKKYVFNAAPDGALYTKTLALIDQSNKQANQENNLQKPYFITLQTISAHKPYNTPYGKDKTSMMRYTDRTLYSFYQKLKTKKFFENGILIIVGDHRKMDAVNKNEFNKRGISSHSRIIGTIIGKGIKPGQYNQGYIQHIDIFYSIKKLVAK